MSIETTFSTDKSTCTISVSGDFNFMLLRQFREAYSSDEITKNTRFVVDLRNTDTVDSSALGMLLNMQRNLERPDRDIEIVNANATVMKIFKITHFEKKFKIET